MAKHVDNPGNPDLELMRHFDGEAGASAGDGEAGASAGKAHTADDAEAKLEALASLQTAFRDAMEAEADSASDDVFAAMWSRVEHKISANGAGKHAVDEAVEAPASRPRAETSGPGIFDAISGWFDRYRSQLLTGAVCAAAAAVLVWFVRPPEKTVEYVEVQAKAGAPAIIPAHLTSEPAEIESLEVYDGSGVVFTIPSDGDDDAPTTVIWLSPPENSVEGPI